MSKEYITLQVGSAGIRSGFRHWEQLAYEHAIAPDGTKAENYDQLNNNRDNSFFRMFSETKDGRLTPNCLHFDLDCESSDEIKNGPFSKMYDQSQFINYQQ